MKKHFLLFTLLSIFFSKVGFSQFSQNTQNNIIVGIQGGYNHSRISALDQTIIPEPFFINYTSDSKKFSPGGNVGVFVNYRLGEGSVFAIQGETMFSMQSGKFSMSNQEKDFNYEIGFKYQYVNFNILGKIYPMYSEGGGFVEGINIGVGAQYGLNVASDNIKYKSWGSGYTPAFGTDLQQQQQLQNVLKGKNSFSLIGAVGYEVQNESLPLVFDFRVNYGFYDVVETQANSYNFRDNKNKNLCFQFTVGCYIW